MRTILLLLTIIISACCDLYEVNLPKEHLPYYFNLFPETWERCGQDDRCPFKDYRGSTKACWGYEPGCEQSNYFSVPECPGDHRGWVKSKQDQINTFFTQADFGFVRDQVNELTVMCEPKFLDDSSLECSKHLKFCRGRNIFVNFTSLVNRKELLRYKMDVLNDGDIGGRCKLFKDRLNEECDEISPLQSWGPEMRFFQETSQPVGQLCDVTVDKPTFIMKIDAINMYHHFCDFFNLYASQHVNASHPDTFSPDVHVLVWESYRYFSNFAETFEAFTRHPIWNLNTFKGKTVCFKNVVFPLLPRMIFGLYYNTPIVWGCQKSGLFKAFSQHVLHRLQIPEVDRQDDRLRVTLLSRDTSFRNILNEGELLDALRNNSKYSVRRVVYNHPLTFKEQLQITRNTDIFIGIHGAGLTHLLFLPDWAVVFELYNCEDESCYLDLARLRGVKYITWEDKSKLVQQDEGHHPGGGAHAKFTNYKFDVGEFIRLVVKGEDHIRRDEVNRRDLNMRKIPDRNRMNREIPLRDVSLHDTATDCWIVLFNRVYNVTDFLKQHPGGPEVMLECGGRDATLQFQQADHPRELNLNVALAEYFVGILPLGERLELF